MSEKDFHQDPRLGPFITALLCERILQEIDGVKSAVRIIDQVNRQAAGPSIPTIMEPFNYALGLLVRLKAGAARGTYQLKVEIRKPSNTIFAQMPHPVHLPGPDDAGHDLAFNMDLPIDEAGTWWFDIYLNEEKWTMVPLRVVYLPHISQPRPR